MEFHDFPYGIIILTDFHIFQRGRYTTNQIVMCVYWRLHLQSCFAWLTSHVGGDATPLCVLDAGCGCGGQLLQILHTARERGVPSGGVVVVPEKAEGATWHGWSQLQ